MTVGKFKSEFSQVLSSVAKGKSVAIAYGRKHVPVAMIVPYHGAEQERMLGVREGRAFYRWRGDGRIDDEEFLQS